MATRGWRALLAVLLVSVIAVPRLADARGWSAPAFLPVSADIPAVVRNGAAARLGSVAVSAPMHLVFSLTGRDPAGLNQLLHDLYDPRSPRFHRYLAASAYAARFGPDPAAVQALIAWLRSKGLHTSPWHGGPVLDVQGDAGHIGPALRVALARYATRSRARGADFYAATGAPLLPAALAPTVHGIIGLSQDPPLAAHWPVPIPAQAVPPLHAGNLAKAARAAGRVAQAVVTGYIPSQIAAAYNFAAIYGAGDRGQGTHIALVELAPFQTSDIRAFTTKFGLATPVINQIAIDGGNGGEDPNVEATLDIELLASAAPGATFDVYNAPNDPDAAGILDAYTRIANDDTAQVLSTSWVHCEPIARGIPTYVDTQHALFQQMASEGITVVAATGDAGAYGCADQPPPPDANPLTAQPAVNTPASDPFVLAVGASDATISSAGAATALSETAWSCPPTTCGEISEQGGGSGGGLSDIFKQGDQWKDDLSWQTGPGVRNAYSNGARQVPDVVFAGSVGNLQHEYSIIYQGQAEVANGTSAAAPMWAGLIALTDQYLMQQGGQALGWVNGMVYRLGAAPQPYPPYHDITKGDNLLYHAGPGWDFATGWGSPDAWNFLRDVAALESGAAVGDPSPTASATAALTATVLQRASATPSGIIRLSTPTSTTTAVPTSDPAQICPLSGIANGDFGAGSLRCWQTGGGSKPALSRTMHFKGRYSARLGAAQAGGHTDSRLSQPFTIPASLKHPVLHVSYWMERNPAPTQARSGACASACARLAQAALPTVTVQNAQGAVVAIQRLAPRRERAWSGIAMPLKPIQGRLTLVIAVPPQPPGASLLLYVDQVRLS